MKVHIIPHTHWDREWCQTFQEYRVKLIKMIDRLIYIIENYPDYKFLLDGQTIILEDYLEVRPEKREKLEKYIRNGNIFVGPWYVQPDEFLVSGESLIRNLLIGSKISEKFGNRLNVGYVPDSFGHISQLPQIFKGFDIEDVVLWRGVGRNESLEYIWKAPSGDEVFLVHLQSPLFSGYSNGWYLSYEIPFDILNIHLEALSKNANTPNIILMNGRDHAEPNEKVLENIKKLNELYKEHTFILSTLEDYISDVKSYNPKLIVLQGELRNYSFGTDYILSGVLSARNYLKLSNFEVYHKTEKILEPLAIVNYLNSGVYDSNYLEYLWKLILQNHAHDSICGCSIDEVHVEMEGRFVSIRGLIREFLRSISINLFGGGEDVILFNPTPKKRTSTFVIPIFIKEDLGKGIKIYDEEKRELKYQLLSIQDTYKFYMDEKNIRITEKGKEYTIALNLDLPGLGFRKISIEKNENRYMFVFNENISKSFGILENEYLKVLIQPNGSLIIENKETGEVYKNLHIFEDGGDIGDLYNYCPPYRDRIYTTYGSKANISLINNGEFLAEYLVEVDFEVPKDTKNEYREEELIKLPIKSYISLRKEERFVRIRTEISNYARNHRLRVLFESGVQNSNTSFSYTPFDVVERDIKPLDPKGRNEYPYNFHPFQYFMGITDGKKGLMIASKGLYEYEVFNDQERTIALTLIRSVGFLSRELPSRYNIAGPIIETPSAQCIRSFQFEYAIIPMSGPYHNYIKDAFEFIDDIEVLQGKDLPNINSLFEIDGSDAIFLSAIKKAEKDEGIVVRFCNLSKDVQEVNIKTGFKFKKVEEVKLNEEKIRDLEFQREEIKIKILGKKIFTLKFYIEYNNLYEGPNLRGVKKKS
ncbi:MAG: alpha-mannosidase [Dictyoglomaceae bacterium]